MRGRNSSVYKQDRYIVQVNTLYGEHFEIECKRESEAEFIRKAVECYVNFDSVHMHMERAIESLKEVAPSNAPPIT